MRRVVISATFILSAVVVCVRAAPRQENSVRLLAEARQALGGDAALAAMHSFTMHLAIKGEAGQQAQFGWVDIACELPDKFVETEDRVRVGGPKSPSIGVGIGSRAQIGSLINTSGQYAHDTAVAGFNGNTPIFDNQLEAPLYQREDRGVVGVQGERPERGRAAVVAARANFARITMGLLVESLGGAPVQFTDVPNDPNAVIVSGLGTPLTLTFDPRTHLPATFGTLTYADYRVVKGAKVPFKLLSIEGVGRGAYLEEWDVREFHVNPWIPPGTFRPGGLAK